MALSCAGSVGGVGLRLRFCGEEAALPLLAGFPPALGGLALLLFLGGIPMEMTGQEEEEGLRPCIE